MEEAYGDAYKQLAEGKANLVSQAESLEKLGVKATKALPAPFRDAVDDDAPAAIPSDPSGPSSS